MHDVKVFSIACYPSGTKQWNVDSLLLDFGSKCCFLSYLHTSTPTCLIQCVLWSFFNSFRASNGERFDGRWGKNILCVNIWDSFIYRQTVISSERKTFEHVGIDKRNLKHSMGRSSSVYLHFKTSLYVKQTDWNQTPHGKTRLIVNNSADVAFLDEGVVRKVLPWKWYRLAGHGPSRQDSGTVKCQMENAALHINPSGRSFFPTIPSKETVSFKITKP